MERTKTLQLLWFQFNNVNQKTGMRKCLSITYLVRSFTLVLTCSVFLNDTGLSGYVASRLQVVNGVGGNWQGG